MVPLPGITPQPSFQALLVAVRNKQGAAYRGDDNVAWMICERDPSFCHSYVATQNNVSTTAAPAPRQGGCGSCKARAAARMARNNGGTIR